MTLYKKNPYKIGDKEYFKAWWRKNELTLCEIVDMTESNVDFNGYTCPPSVTVRPLEGNPHMRYISLRELKEE